MATKAKKVNTKNKAKKVNPEARAKALHETGLAFKTLISNNACIEEGRRPWWAAIIVGVMTLGLGVVPTMVTYFNVQGSQVLAAPLYNSDLGLASFNDALLELKDSAGLTAEIVDGKLSFHTGTQNGKEAFETLFTFNQTRKDNGEPINVNGIDKAYYHYTEERIGKWVTTESSDSEGNVSSETNFVADGYQYNIDLAVYWLKDDSLSVSKNYSSYCTYSSLNVDPNGAESIKTSKASVLILGEEGFAFHKALGGTVIGSWKNFPNRSLMFDVSEAEDIDAKEQIVIKEWKSICKIGYNETRIKNAWIYTGINAAIIAGSQILFGLFVFLFSRGKNNPMRVLTYWQSQKIAFWASFAPAVLNLLAFIPILKNLMLIFFVILYGFRIMWMSMRSLRPMPQ